MPCPAATSTKSETPLLEEMHGCYNNEIDRRTPGGAHGREAHIGPRLSERSLAVAQGTWPVPPVRGVQHRQSEAMLARIAAKDLDRKLAVARTPTQKRLTSWAGVGHRGGITWYGRDLVAAS